MSVFNPDRFCKRYARLQELLEFCVFSSENFGPGDQNSRDRYARLQELLEFCVNFVLQVTQVLRCEHSYDKHDKASYHNEIDSSAGCFSAYQPLTGCSWARYVNTCTTSARVIFSVSISFMFLIVLHCVRM